MICPQDYLDVKKLNLQQCHELLEIIISKLDDYDCDDFFGTEGWRHNFRIEDKRKDKL
jgi:hypothetical protein